MRRRNKKSTCFALVVIFFFGNIGAHAEVAANRVIPDQMSHTAAAVQTGVTPQVTNSETFPDLLGQWEGGWLYQNTNLENYYVAAGTCDANFRGNQPEGLWISDDRSCGTLNPNNPVRINVLNGFGDTATSFSLDQYACVNDIVFNIYDRDGALDQTVTLPSSCLLFTGYSFVLNNGISAFEYAATEGSQVEGNVGVDNVVLDTGVVASMNVSPAATKLISTQIFDMSVVIEGTGPAFTVDRLSATLNGKNISAILDSCAVAGTLVSGGVTFRCPRVSAAFVGLGVHHLTVTANINDGSVVTDTVIWEVLEAVEP